MRANDAHLSHLIQKWGNAASIAFFDPKIAIFNTPITEGIIGYRTIAKNAVVLGEPVCAADNIHSLTGAFFQYCQEQGKSGIYVPVPTSYIECVRLHHPACSMHIGDEIVLNPTINHKEQTGADARRLRNKCNQAARDGVIIKEYTGLDAHLEASFEQMMREWLQNRRGPQIFQQAIDLFGNRCHKRWFYAEHNGMSLGLITLTKIQKGWVLTIAIMGSNAPRYLSEVMILEILDILRSEECDFLSIGTVPSVQIGEVDGMGIVSKKLAQSVYKVTQKVFKLGHRQQFWKKFNPTTIPMHVVFSGSKIKISEIVAVVRAFNGHI